MDVLRTVTVATAICFAASAFATTDDNESDVGVPDEVVVANELRALDDPTILKRRMWLDSEYNAYHDGSDDLVETFGWLWAWRLAADQDWAVRIKLPVQFHDAGDAPGDSNEQGVGDLKIAVGTAWRFGERTRGGVGLELRLPSASDDALSNNAWQLQQFGSFAWNAADWLTLSPSYEYNNSTAVESGASPKNYLELYFPVVLLLPDRWAVTPRFELKIDFANHDDTTHSGKLTIAKQFDPLPLGLALSFKEAFDSSAKRYQANFIATYYLTKPRP